MKNLCGMKHSANVKFGACLNECKHLNGTNVKTLRQTSTKKGFTLAEVLITLAIIGVVAALTIPSVVANTQQQEFKTGLRKAVSVLNSAITMNMAIDGETPYENNNLYSYLARHMSIMKTNALTPAVNNQIYTPNAAFYTTDGMRFEFGENTQIYGANLKLHENPALRLRGAIWNTVNRNTDTGTFEYHTFASCGKNNSSGGCGYCGSYGLNGNTDNTITAPCLIVVDVNGDRKPFPKNASCFDVSCANSNTRKFSDVQGKKLSDSFAIMITDKQAIPYGVAAQKAMYEAQK